MRPPSRRAQDVADLRAFSALIGNPPKHSPAYWAQGIARGLVAHLTRRKRQPPEHEQLLLPLDKC
jgi:hypothetical protein